MNCEAVFEGEGEEERVATEGVALGDAAVREGGGEVVAVEEAACVVDGREGEGEEGGVGAGGGVEEGVGEREGGGALDTVGARLVGEGGSVEVGKEEGD